MTSCFSELTTDSRISLRLASCSAHTETPVALTQQDPQGGDWICGGNWLQDSCMALITSENITGIMRQVPRSKSQSNEYSSASSFSINDEVLSSWRRYVEGTTLGSYIATHQMSMLDGSIFSAKSVEPFNTLIRI